MIYKSHTSYPIHPTEHTLLSTATMSTAPATAIAHVTFNPEDRLHPNNLSEVKEQWDEAMRLEYGIAGSFIGKGKYHEEEEPPLPDVLNTTDEHTMMTFGYELALGLWQLMQRALISTKPGDTAAQQEAAPDSYNLLRQREQHSTAEHYKESLTLPDNGTISIPESTQAACDRAVNPKPTKAKEEISLVSERKATRTSGDKSGDRRDPDQYYKTDKGFHHIPKGEMTMLIARAVERGYKHGTCAVCGEHHRAHTCPSYPEKGTPTTEDAHVAEASKHTSKKTALKDSSGMVVLDTRSSEHLYHNLANISHLRDCKPKSFYGTDGRERIAQVGEHKHVGTVYIRPRPENCRKVNILSLQKLEATPGMQIAYSQDEGTFRVTTPTGYTITFTKRDGRDNLYVSDEAWERPHDSEEDES